MKNRIVKVVSYFMLVVFLLGIAPKEYLHELLYDHKDTVHKVFKKGELEISNKHTHCSFLGFVFAPFIATEKTAIAFEPAMLHAACFLSFYRFQHSSTHKVHFLRGPPLVC